LKTLQKAFMQYIDTVVFSGFFIYFFIMVVVQRACSILVGHHDFSSFRAAGCQVLFFSFYLLRLIPLTINTYKIFGNFIDELVEILSLRKSRNGIP
jgi:hypothetical protein